MPAYWFMYNMYALARNSSKYTDRDRRTQKIQMVEYDFLAPDTINELFLSIKILQSISTDDKGNGKITGWENMNRPTEIVKVDKALTIFRELIIYYGITSLLNFIHQNKSTSFDVVKKGIPTKIKRSEWLNIGGQLIQTSTIEKLKKDITSNKVKSWDEVHEFYVQQGKNYEADKLSHAYTALLEILNITPKQFTDTLFKELLQQVVGIKEWMCKGIYDSRAKDYTSPFRKMVYENNKEMNKILGKIEDNFFIQQQFKEFEQMKAQVKSLIKKMKL